MPRRGCDGGAPALECGDALFQHRHGRIGQPRIDVAEIVQVEERGGVVDVVEHVGRRLIDRGRTRASRRIGRRAGMDRAGFEAEIQIARRRRAGLDPALQRRRGRPVLDDAAVDAAPRQFAAESPKFDLRTAVHDHFEPGRLRRLRRLVVPDAQLHPHHLGANGDRVRNHARRLVGVAEHVDHVDVIGNVAQRRIGHLAEQRLPGYPRIDRDHAIAFALQVLHHEVAGAVPIRRRADKRDRPNPLEDRADLRVGIGNRLQVGHALTLSCERRPF